MKSFVFATLLAFTTPSFVFGWGQPHLAITRAALEVLPAWQKAALGAEFKPLGDNYCLIPDHVFTDKGDAKYAKMESAPNEVYLKILHLPTQQPEADAVETMILTSATRPATHTQPCAPLQESHAAHRD